MAARPFRLVDHDRSMAALEAVISRTGVAMEPEAFIALVSRVFQSVQNERAPADMSARFRADPCYAKFREALVFSSGRARKPAAVMVLGCGAGLAGCSPDYAVSVLQEVFPADTAEQIGRIAVAAEHIRDVPDEQYDLMISHSMMHFVPDLNAFGEAIHRLVAPGGIYVMGHEPNARFHANRECMQVRAAAKRPASFTRRLRSAVQQRLQSMRGTAAGGSLHDDINRVLQTQHGFRSALSAVEISRIVDPHFPADGSAEFRIGCDGFDWDDLHCHLFPDFQLAWTGTSGHLGVIDRTRLDAKWLAEERRLSERYPLDGSGFSAVWIRD